jgi:hypothetical protein
MQEIFVSEEKGRFAAKRNGKVRTGSTRENAIANLKVAEMEALEGNQWERRRQRWAAFKKFKQLG